MYIPKHNREDDRETLLGFMRAYSFATLVTARDALPRATHLPFVIDADGAQVLLIAHLARANDQWRDFAESGRVLVIFQEPHAYISPRHYKRSLSVPTWNYVAVHAYGHTHIYESPGVKLDIVKRLIRHTDAEYLAQFEALPAEFVEAKLKGIVAFRIVVDELQGRFKLSQDRSRAEQATIIHALQADEDRVRAAIGELMSERFPPV
jgi:transcriptional regulator